MGRDTLACHKCNSKGNTRTQYAWDGIGWECGKCVHKSNIGYYKESMNAFRSGEELITKICNDCKKEYQIHWSHYDLIGGSVEENFCKECKGKHDVPEERIVVYRNVSVTPHWEQKVNFQPFPEKDARGVSYIRLRFLVFQRDNYHCILCGRGVEDGQKLELCHRIADSKQGKLSLENTFCGCWECNHGMRTDVP